jgi:hypothetical protein
VWHWSSGVQTTLLHGAVVELVVLLLDEVVVDVVFTGWDVEELDEVELLDDVELVLVEVLDVL